ncbi:hypothetical protein SAMN04488561_1559 [Jiangella alba]|uniref:Uncharacterized protein n=1 Tax=Jiangella alba TaxID=561176 RepID=A0A1H5JFA7_9ACTN|nr:hypothetical protein SAMN04488561_1559 [Jiangella alba]
MVRICSVPPGWGGSVAAGQLWVPAWQVLALAWVAPVIVEQHVAVLVAVRVVAGRGILVNGRVVKSSSSTTMRSGCSGWFMTNRALYQLPGTGAYTNTLNRASLTISIDSSSASNAAA